MSARKIKVVLVTVVHHQGSVATVEHTVTVWMKRNVSRVAVVASVIREYAHLNSSAVMVSNQHMEGFVLV